MEYSKFLLNLMSSVLIDLRSCNFKRKDIEMKGPQLIFCSTLAHQCYSELMLNLNVIIQGPVIQVCIQESQCGKNQLILEADIVREMFIFLEIHLS